MNLVAKVGIGAGTIAGAGGGIYGIYHNITTSATYSEIFKGTLLTTTGNSHETNWKARLVSLKAVVKENELAEGLKEIKYKQGDNIWTELRDWCGKHINKSNKGKEDKEFQGIQNYCTFSIKEKITKAIPESAGNDDAKWADGHAELKNIDDKELDDTLKEIKQKTVETEIKKSVKDWCIGAYKKPFKGNEDQEFKNASKICIPKT